MKTKTKKIIAISILAMIYLFGALHLVSAVIVNADYETVFPGEQVKIEIEIDNNENFDIEDVSLALDLSDVPFSSVGSSEKDYNDIDEDDDEQESFTIRASTGIIPGDYDLPYVLKYVNAENNSETFEKEGSFGIRVSAKTDLDYVAETNDNAIMGEEGRITIEVVNRGLGDIKSVSVELIPNGFELLSKNKIFVGTVDADDSDTATFDVIYKTSNPSYNAKITYKDFDNQDHEETISFVSNVYTREQALSLGLIEKQSYTIFFVIGIIVVLFIVWRIRKRRKKKQKNKEVM